MRVPHPYVLGLGGPELRIPADLAVMLWPAIDAWVAEHKRMGATSKLEAAKPAVDAWRYMYLQSRRVRFAREPADGGGEFGPASSPHDQIPASPPPEREGNRSGEATCNTAEAAKVLGCTAKHVRVLADRGDLDGCKVGRDWVIDRRSVVEHLRRSG